MPPSSALVALKDIWRAAGLELCLYHLVVIGNGRAFTDDTSDPQSGSEQSLPFYHNRRLSQLLLPNQGAAHLQMFPVARVVFPYCSSGDPAQAE
jgi:hypothetical protein